MLKPPSETAIARYAAVSQVLAKVAAGMTLCRATCEVAKTPPRHLDGRRMSLSVRTLQRFIAAYQEGGIEALELKSRASSSPSKVLTEDFLAFLVRAKALDPEASIPDVIRSAQRLGIVSDARRVTVWRAARRLNLPIFATKAVENDDMHRFEFAHRMQMGLADGKHFRVGAKNKKRVVVTYLDDHSRFALGAVVGTSESSRLFLRGLWKVLLRWGYFDRLFMDNGSGFTAKDCATVAARLGLGSIFGTEGYAEGRGKIERYHRTLTRDLLRSFRNNSQVDSDLLALEYRIEHYLMNDYNRRGHESLDYIASEKRFQTPEERFLSDGLPLRPVESPDKVKEHFVITERRKVSRDNVVMVKRVAYEVPRGHAGRWVDVQRHLLERTVSIIHDGRLIELAKVDKILNAVRGRAKRSKGEKETTLQPFRTAATILFDQNHQPLVGKSGDFFEKE